ncbi:DUF202 domain-containing protein [Bacteroidota bacterium]
MEIKKNLYQKFIEKALPLNDQLAAARSILANERTFLSYQRTAITLFIAGASFVKFFEHPWLNVIGWIFIPASVLMFFLGIFRYAKMRDLIRNIEYESFISKDSDNHPS